MRSNWLKNNSIVNNIGNQESAKFSKMLPQSETHTVVAVFVEIQIFLFFAAIGPLIVKAEDISQLSIHVS